MAQQLYNAHDLHALAAGRTPVTKRGRRAVSRRCASDLHLQLATPAGADDAVSHSRSGEGPHLRGQRRERHAAARRRRRSQRRAKLLAQLGRRCA
jgi:hypothetical protein